MDNCKGCLYANELEDKRVFCYKVVLLYGKEVYIDADKVNLPCPSHSNRFIEDWRYTSEGVQDLRNAEDACEVCGRLLNLNDEDTYDVVTEEFTLKNKEGIDETKREIVQKCKICIDKGRNKYIG